MKGNFATCLRLTLAYEGGWSDDPKDPGGATMKGVTLAVYSAFKGHPCTKDDLRAISDADLEAIYRRGYWDRVRGDDLPAGVDLVAFDAAVNSGPRRGAEWLQRAVHVSADGQIGPKTLAAIRAVNPRQVVYDATGLRLAFLRNLDTFDHFGKGWTARIAKVRAAATAMAM